PEMECLLSVLDQKDIPWVTVQRVHHRVHYNYVAANNYSAGRLVGECFLALGYQRVLLLDAQPMPLDSELQKFTGLLSAYLAANVPVIQTQLLVCEDVLEETAYQKISTYLKNNSIPQGIFARGDSLAIGAVRACRDAGLSIPDDVSIVGSTGLDVSAFCNPPLTVASQPMGAIGHAVASMLLNMIETGQRRVAGQTINCTIDLRESLKITPEVTRLIQSQEQEIVPCHGHEVNSSSKPLVLKT
ncbi:MAG: substrate-binding domain-containing protein, partial [Phycisphaeraceae bacterium]|nr:substrate-binding domain-containing protein [Phycisphaeraceae bacterium]